MEFAARWDEPPKHLIDYHTVDLGQPKMNEGGWTTRGIPEYREGGSAKEGIHQRYRHYWADGLMTVVLALKEGGEPDLGAVKDALQRPARPLFLGRKTCLPARPLLDPKTPLGEGENLLAILRKVTVWDRSGNPVSDGNEREACWPAEPGTVRWEQVRRVYDLREWANQIPAGSRWRVEGLIGDDEP